MSSFLAASPGLAGSGLASAKPALSLLYSQKCCTHQQNRSRRRMLRCSSEKSSDGSSTSNEASSSQTPEEKRESTSGGEAQSNPSSSSSPPTPWPASSWPRPSGSSSTAPVCRECRGRRVISSAAGPLPCPACISWRRRPDYKQGQPLLSAKDINLKPLEQQQPQAPLSSSSSSSTSSAFSSIVGGTEASYSIDNSIDDLDGSSSGDEGGGGGGGKPRDRRGQNMTEQKRLAIKMAMQGRGPLDSDHKRRISNAMRERYASDPSLRQAGKPKKCSYCGQLGHNRKKCPELANISPLDSTTSNNSSSGEGESEGEEEQQQELRVENFENATSRKSGNGEIDAVLEKISRTAGANSPAGVRTCSVCGEVGHNKRSCPQLLSQQKQQETAAAATPPPAKFIVIEESVDEDTPSGSFSTTAEEKEEKRIETKPPPPPQEKQQKSKQSAVASYLSLPLSPQQQSQQKIKSIPNVRALPGSNLSLAEDGSLVFPLPSNPEQCVAQAAGAVIRAWSDGVRRQTLELLLPQAGSDTAEGWPGGIRQQFRAALPMIESLLLRLKRAEGLEGRITAEWIDEGDCVGAWQSERLATVVFPTADCLAEVRRIDDALSGNRLMLVVNPQWQPQGQVVSDFGFGSKRRAAERYVASLDEIYYLRRIRVLGDEVRVLRCYPSRWQVHYVRVAGDTELISVEQEKPTYLRLLEILKGVRDSRASKSWLDRALDRGWYDDIAAYNEGSPQTQEEEAAEADNLVEGYGNENRGSGDDEVYRKKESGVIVRDIITGEIISRGAAKDGF